MTVFAKKREIILKGKKTNPFFHTNVSIQRMLFFYLIFLNLFFCACYPLLNKSIFVTVGIQQKRHDLKKL